MKGDEVLNNPKNARFDDLLALCIGYFGEPRVSGSHHIFRTPWPGRWNVFKGRIIVNPDRYTYRIGWSREDEAHIGRCLEFPSLAAHGDTPLSAFEEIRQVVASVLDDLTESGEPVPEPYGDRDYSGKLVLRMPRDVHRELAIKAAEQGISINQYLLSLM